MVMMASQPRPSPLVSSSDDSSPYSCFKRDWTLVSPTPNRRRDPGAGPGPSSRTQSQTLPLWRLAAMSSRAGDIDCEKVSWHVHVNFKPIMKACLFDLQILADKLELALQSDLVLPPFEGHAQQVAQADQQTARGIDVFLHQDSNGVKTVEQKVRM